MKIRKILKMQSFAPANMITGLFLSKPADRGLIFIYSFFISFSFHLFIRHKGYKREKKMKKKKSYCLQSHGEEAQKKPAGL